MPQELAQKVIVTDQPEYVASHPYVRAGMMTIESAGMQMVGRECMRTYHSKRTPDQYVSWKEESVGGINCRKIGKEGYNAI